MTQNPFVIGQWVRGERFYGRTALMQEVLDGPRNWLWLVGTRRLGKTSFLKQLEQITTTTPERGYFPVFWDLQGAEDEDELHQSFREALLDAEEQFDMVNVQLSDVDADDLFAGLGRLRRRLRTSGRRLLLLCDETEELLTINRRDPSLLRKLRRALQSHDDIRSVLTSTIRLWELADQRGDTSPFLHGFAPPLYLSTLTDDEAGLLIGQANLAEPDRPRFAPKVVEEIRTRCDNHPYLIQLTCKRFLELSDLKEAIDQVRIDRMVSHFFSVDYDLLSPMEQTILRLVAQQSAATSNSIQEHLHADVSSVRATLQQLERLAFIRRDPDRSFVLRNSFFRRWLEDWAQEDSASSSVTQAASPGVGLTHAVGVEPGLGTISGRYALLQRAGEGATGIVYKAHDAMLNTDIAIKMLRPEYSKNEAVLDRFRREIILSRDIGHPNVLRTYDLGESNNRKYLTMQWVDGQTLKGLIAAEAPLDEMTGVGIAMRLAAALGPMGAPHVVFDAHAEGVHLGLLPALDEMLDGGASRITVHLDGYGNNIRDILASANGGLLLIAGGGQLRSRRLDSVSAGLVAGLLATLNPLSKPQPSELECAVLRFDIHDGIAHSDRGIGLQTRKVSVVGMGRVDLRTEQVDLGVRPQPRGAIARTDNAFAGVIRITGTLRAPRAEISTQYMLQEGTALGSTLATAGLSNLAGFLHQRVVDTANACQAAANPKPTYSDTEDADHDKADEGSVNGLLPGGYRD